MSLGESLLVAAVVKRNGQAAVNRTAASYQRAIEQTAANFQAVIDSQQQALNEVKQRLAATEMKLTIEEGRAAGLKAQRNVLEALGEKAPQAFRHTEHRFKESGNIKTAIRLIYEKAFDSYLISKGISNPLRHRAD